MRPFPRRGAVLALAAALVAGPVLAATPVMVKLDLPTQKRLGVQTTPLTAARRAATVTGFARVLDPVPLATLDSDIATAASALQASQAEAARTQRLNAADDTVSKRVAEIAAAQARTDASKLALLRRRVALEWGPALGGFSDARRSKLVADIAAGRASLLRIDSSAGLSQLRGSAAIDLGPSGVAHAAILGPTRTGDPRLQSTGLLALVTGPQALRLGAGTVLPATIDMGPGTTGVVVPRSALLRTSGQTFAYIRRDAGSFERRPILNPQLDPQGLFAPAGFQPGEPVVVNGAAALFAAESTPSKAD